MRSGLRPPADGYFPAAMRGQDWIVTAFAPVRHTARSAFTMMEMLVVIAIIVIMSALTVPAINTLVSQNTEIVARNLIRSQLGLAQAQAASLNRNVALRFAFDKQGVFDGKQYMILLERTDECYGIGPWIWDERHSELIPSGGYQYYYAAIPDKKPIALPKGVAAFSISTSYDPINLLEATTFDIIYTPDGNLVTKYVILQPRDASDLTLTIIPMDTERHRSTAGMIIAETDPIHDCPSDSIYVDYLGQITPSLINIYTGQLIDEAI
jgi:prepilin-type N-terminal cleavage/methylation domain-containing protein